MTMRFCLHTWLQTAVLSRPAHRQPIACYRNCRHSFKQMSGAAKRHLQCGEGECSVEEKCKINRREESAPYGSSLRRWCVVESRKPRGLFFDCSMLSRAVTCFIFASSLAPAFPSHPFFSKAIWFCFYHCGMAPLTGLQS
ncbi:unnamed protein product [Ixodes persulcatus]